MSSNFQHELIQRYQYVSTDGRYRVTQWVDDARIIHQEKVGYATQADAIAEADALGRLVEDHNLTGTLYACVDISDLDGVDRAAREVYVSRFQEGDYNWVVALFGANALVRFMGRIFQRRDLALQFRHCKTRRDAMSFLHGQIIRRDDSRVALHPGSFGLGIESRSEFASENANRFVYRSPTGDLFVVYKQIAEDIVFISVNGTLDKREELAGALRVAEQMYQQLAAGRFYVILDSNGVKRVSLAARRAYLEYVKETSARERIVVHIGSQISRFLLRSVRLLTPSTFGTWRSARNMADALKLIELDRDSMPQASMSSPVVDHAAYGPAEDLSGGSVKPIVDWLIHLGWDVNFKPDSLMIDPGHPYHELVMSIQLLQNDLRESFSLQNEQLQALQENREKLEQAQALAKLATWDWQPESGQMNWSPETYRLFGYEADEVIPSIDEFKKLLRPDCRGSVFKMLDNAIASNETFARRVTIIRRDGEERICSLRGRSETHARQKGTIVRVTFLDITDLIQAQLEAERARLVLEEGHAELKAYLAALSHDVRTPLTSLKLGLSRITDEQLPKNLGPTLRAEVEHLDSLFANMLSLARLKVIGTDALAPMPCDLAILADRVRTRLLILAQDRSVEIEVKPVDFDTILMADGLALEQALTNVVHNAIKFAHSRTMIWIDSTPESLTICVQDDGLGMDAAQGERTIEANFGAPLTDLTDGLGLGVAIAKRIMANHGGTLSVTGAEEPGTLVKMHLPRERTESVTGAS